MARLDGEGRGRVPSRLVAGPEAVAVNLIGKKHRVSALGVSGPPRLAHDINQFHWAAFVLKCSILNSAWNSTDLASAGICPGVNLRRSLETVA
jgi:hypothetical protein